ncbi:MAG: methionine biosynthesis protein MetW [Candidatus Omnitrophota bacterium]
MKSINHWHPSIYSFFIRLSYRRNYRKRYEPIVDLIADGSSVTDVCCGDCRIYGYLKDKNVKYIGLDFNPQFIASARKKGIDARIFNVYDGDIPVSDYVMMQGSLYQFYPRHVDILRKMYAAASKYLIISEPVKNNADSGSPIIASLARALNNPGDGTKAHRFKVDTLKVALEPFRNLIVKEFPAAGGIDYVAVIKKN